jgi:hypothetical protein
MPEFPKPQETDQVVERYMCMFCSCRANEKLPVGGCPGCGSAWPYGKVRALQALQVYCGVLFIVFSGFCFYFSAIALKDIFQGDKIPWGIFALLFGLGGILAAGGVSSLFGKSWLLRLLLVFFGVALRRRR